MSVTDLRIAISLAAIACLGAASPVKAMDPVTAYAAKFLAQKFVEGAWDSATGKPDVEQVNERLKVLENGAALKGEMRTAVRQLRESINERVTLQEFRAMAANTVASIDSINRRLADIEERSERQEVEIQDLKSGTNNAQSAEFFESRGDAQIVEKSYHRAIANFNIAIRLNPKKASAYPSRAWAYWQLQAPGATIVDATEALRLNPNVAFTANLRGCAHNAIQDYEHGLADFSEAIRIDSKFPGVYLNRALTHNLLGNRAEAIADFTKAIELDPRNAWAFISRGEAHGARGEGDLAIADYTAAIGIDGTLSLAYYNRALIYEARNNRLACLADLNEAIRVNPTWGGPYYKRGLVHGDEEGVMKWVFVGKDLRRALDISRADRAVTDYETAVRLNREFANSTRDREYSDLLTEWGQYFFYSFNDSLIPRFTEAIRLNPDNEAAYAGRAQAYYLHEENDKAMADITVALRLNPDDPQAYTVRASIYRSMGDLRRAKQDELKAERLGK